jgi:hypothetical protein
VASPLVILDPVIFTPLGVRLMKRRLTSPSAQTWSRRPSRRALIGLCGLWPLSFAASAAIYTVTNTNDSGPGSLRQAVLDANASVTVVDTINFAPNVTGVITLTSGEITITDRSLTISGPGRDVLAISGNNASRIFVVESTATRATIQDLSLQNGKFTNYSNAGAALTNDSILNLNRMNFTGQTRSSCHTACCTTQEH